MSNNRLALIFFAASLGAYALVLYLAPDLTFWIPSGVFHVVILAFPLALIAYHRENRVSLGLLWGRWRFGVVSTAVVILTAFLIYWIPNRHFFAPAIDYILISTVVFGPISEELLFRGYLQPKLESVTGRWVGLAITSVLFGIAHLPKIYFRQAAPVVLVPEAFALGMAFGFIRDRTGSVYYGMLCHMAYNLIVSVV